MTVSTFVLRFRMTFLDCLRHTPRAVLAVLLIAAFAGLSVWEESWRQSILRQGILKEPGFAPDAIWYSAMVAPFFLPGALQRWKWRQMLAMTVLGSAVVALNPFLNDAIFPHAPTATWILTPTIVMLAIGVAEWFFTRRESRSTMAWVVLACLGAALLAATLNRMLYLVGPHSTSGNWDAAWLNYRGPAIECLLVWLAVPIGATASASKNRAGRWLVGAEVASSAVLCGWFFCAGVYTLAERSLTGEGPFSRATGIALLGNRGRAADFEAIWDDVVEADWTESNRIPVGDDAVGEDCVRALAEIDPAETAERISAFLLARPNRRMAEASAAVLAEHHRCETVPLLLRYALLGDSKCTRALEIMRIPQAGWALLMRGALDAPLNINTQSSREAGGKAVVDEQLQQRFADLLGRDAGSRLDDWETLCNSLIPDLPTPLNADQKRDVDAVVACWKKYLVTSKRAGTGALEQGHKYARQKMLDNGRKNELAALDERMRKVVAGEPGVHSPQPGDELYDFFKEYLTLAAEGAKQKPIPGPDWNAPTIAALQAEVERYVKEVELAYPEEPANDGG